MARQPIFTPAPYAATYAVGYADQNGELALVATDSPLPVAPVEHAVPPTLEGISASSVVVGPFLPLAGRAVIVCLDGTWTGTISVQRSTDGGSSRLPLSAAGNAWARFTANACEPVWEEASTGAELYLDIALTSGSVAYRLGH